jgi:hypothetical protein
LALKQNKLTDFASKQFLHEDCGDNFAVQIALFSRAPVSVLRIFSGFIAVGIPDIRPGNGYCRG